MEEMVSFVAGRFAYMNCFIVSLSVETGTKVGLCRHARTNICLAAVGGLCVAPVCIRPYGANS